MRPSMPVWDASIDRPTFLSSNLALPEVIRRDSACTSSSITDLESENSSTEGSILITATSIAEQVQNTQIRIFLNGENLATSPIAHVGQSHRQVQIPASLRPRNSSILQSRNAPYTQPLRQRYTNPGPLYLGPTGYIYTPLSARTPEYESLRHDFGIRFRKHVAPAQVMLNWDLLCDEDATPNLYRERLVECLTPGFLSKKPKKLRDEDEEISVDSKKKMGLFAKVKNWVRRKFSKFAKGSKWGCELR